MTCIVGTVENGRVWLGADSAGVDPDTRALEIRRDPKVFRNGVYVIGVAGSWKANQFLRFAEIPDPGQYAKWTRAEPPDGEPWICNHLMKWIRENAPPAELLIGFAGRIYHVYGHEQVSMEKLDFDAAGSGAQIARGALYALTTTPQSAPMVRLNIALEAAERFCADVRGPFQFVT